MHISQGRGVCEHACVWVHVCQQEGGNCAVQMYMSDFLEAVKRIKTITIPVIKTHSSSGLDSACSTKAAALGCGWRQEHRHRWVVRVGGPTAPTGAPGPPIRFVMLFTCQCSKLDIICIFISFDFFI